MNINKAKKKKRTAKHLLYRRNNSKLQYTDLDFDAILNKDEIFYLLKDIKNDYRETFILVET